MNLKDKTVLITGASGGIGSAIAKAFAKEKAKLILAYSKNEQTIKRLEKNLAIKCDLKNRDEISKMFLQVKEKFPSIDILVNVAGIEKVSEDPLDTSDWEDIIAVNLYGAVECSRHAIKMMNEGGVIINIASIAGSPNVAFAEGSLSYAVSKAALIKFTEQLAMMVAPKIRVIAISPGYVLTPMWDSFTEADKKEAVDAVPLKRFIKPEEVAQAVIAVAQNDAITGQNFVVDAGLVLKEIK